MSALSLSATYTGITFPEDRWWVRLEQIPVKTDVATVAETASFLDTAFNLDPCEQAITEETNTVTDAATATEETVVEAAGASFDLAICSQEPDGSVEIQVKVIRSHQTENYRLHVAGGTIVSTLVMPEELTRVDTVESATSFELDYPVLGAFAASWQNDLVTASGSASEIRRNGNTIYWPESATGSIQSSYLTTYDLVTIRVHGVDGDQGAATIRVVFHALAEDLVPDLPDPADFDRSLCPKYQWRFKDVDDVVTCYKEIALTTRCACSGQEIGYRTYDQVVPCPEWIKECPGNLSKCMVLLGSEAATEYVECAGDNEIPGRPGMVYSVSRAGYYEDVCCRPAPGSLPDCLEKITSYRGGQPINLGKEVYRNLYGPATHFIPVAPKGGICGQHITRQVVRSGNCCDGVPPLVWNTSVSPEVMPPNSSAIIGIAGGRPPYTWTVNGEGFQFSTGSTEIITSSLLVRLSALPLACGTAEITVTDGCSTVVGIVRSTAGGWTLRGSFHTLSWYKNLGLVDDCVDSFYTVDTDIPATQISGRWAMSYADDGPATDNRMMVAGTGAYCADRIITGETVVDPIAGAIHWVACVDSFWLYPLGSSPNWVRPFMVVPGVGSNYMHIYEWTC